MMVSEDLINQRLDIFFNFPITISREIGMKIVHSAIFWGF